MDDKRAELAKFIATASDEEFQAFCNEIKVSECNSNFAQLLRLLSQCSPEQLQAVRNHFTTNREAE